nr:MAG TPA: hypothetical protein [Caudoviricetes sp.]
MPGGYHGPSGELCGCIQIASRRLVRAQLGTIAGIRAGLCGETLRAASAADLCDGAAPLRSNLAWRTLTRKTLEQSCVSLAGFSALTPHHPKGTSSTILIHLSTVLIHNMKRGSRHGLFG